MSVTCLAIGDPHFQTNNVLETEELIRKIHIVVDNMKPDFVVILGDLLHTHEKIHVIPLNMATKLITTLAEKVKTYLLIGNHDYCLGEYTPVLKWIGQSVYAKDIKIGDILVGDDGKKRVVSSIRTGVAPMYRITQSDGYSFNVTGNHTLILRLRTQKVSKWSAKDSKHIVSWISDKLEYKSELCDHPNDLQIPNEMTIHITVNEYIKLDKNIKKNLSVIFGDPISWDQKPTEMDPYEFRNFLPIVNSIPDEYKYNSIENRAKLIKGFLDINDTYVIYKNRLVCNVNKCGHLLIDIILMLKGLGMYPTINKTILYIIGDISLLKLSQKLPNDVYNQYITISVNRIDDSKYYGFEVDQNNTFLLGNYSVTHNCNNLQFLTDKHPFNSFKEVKNVTVCDQVVIDCVKGKKFVFCPYVPPERFEEALNTVENIGEQWIDANCIFAHQEFYGCRFNPVTTSIEGDIWPEDYPLVVSGHIHDSQRLQSNIYYTGSSMQHGYSESDKKSIAFLTFNDKFNIQKIDLELRRKKIVYIDVEDADSYVPDPNINIKLVIQGTSEQFKVFRRGQVYKDLIKKGIVISFSPKGEIIQPSRNIKKESLLSILEKLIENDNKYVKEAFNTLNYV
jgi:DNA repair exonuclease SbcCD nuclease subunit